MRELNLDEFSGREGQAFDLVHGEKTLPFILATVQPLPGSLAGREAFKLEWLGPYEPVLEQGTYTFRLDDEPVEIFIVPTGRDRDGVQYEAVFN
jgi:hypothetical protein